MLLRLAVETTMDEKYETTITPSYIQLRSIYIGAEVPKTQLKPGQVTVLLADDPEFSVVGKLNQQGLLTGMAKLHKHLDLRDGTRVEFSIGGEDSITIHLPNPPIPRAVDEGALEFSPEPQTVFEKNNLKHIHIEAFRPENLENWAPETETDVYLAFGVLQELTDFLYCCGVNKGVIAKLGANYDGLSMPDAILIDRTNDQYLMAEWKKLSSDFKTNHKPGDVDVLVCWLDDESDQSRLPPRVLALHSVAKTAAEIKLANK